MCKFSGFSGIFFLSLVKNSKYQNSSILIHNMTELEKKRPNAKKKLSETRDLRKKLILKVDEAKQNIFISLGKIN